MIPKEGIEGNKGALDQTNKSSEGSKDMTCKESVQHLKKVSEPLI